MGVIHWITRSRRAKNRRIAAFAIGCTCGGLAFPACSNKVEMSESEAALAQPLEVSTTADDGDRPSPQAITAIWAKTGTANVTSLTARVQNATSERKMVDVALVGLDPLGREVSRKLGKRTVSPRSALELVIPVHDLPVQSAAYASPQSIAVTYDIDVVLPDGKSTRISHVVHSAATYVAFSDDFAAATARSAADEASNGRQPKAARARLKIRHYNPASARFDEQVEVAGDDAPALLGVTNVAPGPLPGAEAQP